MNITISKKGGGTWSVRYSGRLATLAGASTTTSGEVVVGSDSAPSAPKAAIDEAVKLSGATGRAAFHLAELLRIKLKKSDRADVEIHAAPPAEVGA